MVLGISFDDVHLGVSVRDYASGEKRNQEDVSRTNLHTLDEDELPETLGDVTNGNYTASQKYRYLRSRKTNRYILYALAAIALIVTFWSMIALLNSKQDSTKIGEWTLEEREELTVRLFRENGVIEVDELYLEDSPARQAIIWLSREDGLQLDVPKSNADDTYDRYVQRYAAATLAFAFGADKLQSYGLLTEENECDWNFEHTRTDSQTKLMGFTCDGTLHHVEEVVLQELGLVGSIPTEVGLLKHVRRFKIDANEIHGGLPEELRRLKRLRELTLTSNNMNGTLPRWLGTFPELTELELSFNSFSGDIAVPYNHEDASDSLELLAVDGNFLYGSLQALRKLTNLEVVYLNDNSFAGHIHDNFVDMANLYVLDLSDNELIGKVPENVMALPSLEVLDLHSNSLTGVFPHTPFNVTNLFFLDLYDNMIAGEFPKTVYNFPAMKHLDLSKNKFEGDFIPEFSWMENLEFLFLSDLKQMNLGPIPDWVSDMENMKHLSFKGSRRKGEIPDWIGDGYLMNLRLLDLERNELYGTIPDNLGNLEQLKYLLLNRNELTGTIPDSLGQLGKLILLLVDNNFLNGTVDASSDLCTLKFEYNLDVFIADCVDGEDMVDCGCCTKCCSTQSNDCNNRQWVKSQYAEDWDTQYERPQYYAE